jgi:3'-phosphoadenosine 5'-phosphosulfate sulfotransferase (PAPS reductase)/FAD synthetase
MFKLQTLPENPTSITVSNSGGKDSTFMLLEVVKAFAGSGIPIRAHHQIILEDWPGTVEYVADTCQRLGVELWTDQADYKGMACPDCNHRWLTAISRKKCTTKGCSCLCPKSELVAEITDLKGLVKWRGMWPDKNNRYCTSYLKRDVWNKRARKEREKLGTDPVFCMGERWAESPSRSKLPYTKPRASLENWMTDWHPILHARRFEVFSGIFEAGLDVHPCYYWQGETRATMLDPNREGGARMSCRCCIFKSSEEIELAANLPEQRQFFQGFSDLEKETGHLFKNAMGIGDILAGKHHKRTIQMRLDFVA